MKHTYVSLIIITVFVLFTNVGFSQSQGIKVKGKVIESKSKKPLQFVTVMIKNSNSNKVITGTTTLVDGSFEISSETPDFYAEISFIGFVDEVVSKIQINKGVANLGTILLKEDNKTLDEVVIRAEKSHTEFKLDKRVFNVGKDLSSKGASALEVLNNVPSVNVNIEGEISLRGNSGVQILINGKPSVIASDQSNALGTITAEMIERIEVITNPSAKYDAEGTTGIINIVIKKNERKGFNGSVSVNTGVPHNHSVGVSLNRRTEKFNLFSQFGIGYRELPRDRESKNVDLVNNTTLKSDGLEYRNEQFYNFNLGTDYHINKYNVLTLSGNFAYEIEDQPSETDFMYFNGNDLTSAWNRKETTTATNPKWQYELQYKRDFKDHKKHTLLFSALGNFFGKDMSSEFENTTESGTNDENNQKTATHFQEARYTFKLDYTKPFAENWTIETGAQYVITDVGNDFEVQDFLNDEWAINTGLTNNFEYDQKVLGVYGTGAYENDKLGVKAGLRVENTDLQTYLENTDERNKQLFTNFFPTFHTSYKFTSKFSLQAGYSRRIRRPRLWDLNPFFNIRNNFSIRAGNPNLLPEFTDSYEVTSIYILGKASLNLGVYHRYTTDVVERVATFEDNVNITRPQNIGTERATGVEFNAKYTPAKWVTVNGDVNYNYFMREGELEGTSFDFDASQWSGKATASFKLPADFDLEFTGRYRSKVKTVQGEVQGNAFADLGIKKKIIKGRGVINLSVRDVFASRIWEWETIQDDFYLYNRSLRGRFIALGFSYGFGKGEAMEYSGRRRRF